MTTTASALPLVTVFADGAAKGNGTAGARGGWGFRAEFASGELMEHFGGEKPTTNNRMELMAVIEALTRLPGAHQVALFTDSQYVVKGMSEWLAGWKRRGWKSASGDAVKNRELWERLDRLTGQHRVTFHWVRGHNGHPGNERADALANLGVPN
jgi:ribonuclease HI